MGADFNIRRHPVFINLVIIFVVAIIGIFIAFLSLSIFTRHGEWQTVPEVENMSYDNALSILQEKGFRADLRDSVFNDDIHPGFVVEQFPKPGSKVKPGRKIFLYINALHPREFVIDADNTSSGEALKGYSLRQGLAKLEELGFKNINIIKVPGDNDRIIRILANGKTVSKMQKVPVTSLITIEVYDGMLNKVTDSILDEEYLQYVTEVEEEEYPYEESGSNGSIDIEPAFIE